MSLATFHSGLKARLLADTGLSSWATTHFSKSLTAIDGNRRIKSINQTDVPALIFELGDGDNTEEVGNHYQRPTTEISVVLVWQEQVPETAFAQRLALPDLLIKAVMADGTLGGNVDGAWVSDWSPDRGANHPVQIMRFTVTGMLTVKKP